MDVLIFTTVDGYDVAIPDDDISTIWSAKTPGRTLIERISDTPDIEVEYEFNELIIGYFGHIDLRPQIRKSKKRTAPKPKYGLVLTLADQEKLRDEK